MSEGHDPETDAEDALDLLAQHPNPPTAGVASGWVAEQLRISRMRAINALNGLQAAGKVTLENGAWKHPSWPATPEAPKAARIPKPTPPAPKADDATPAAYTDPEWSIPRPEMATPPPRRNPPPRAGLFSEQATRELHRAVEVLEARIKQDTEAVAAIRRLLA